MSDSRCRSCGAHTTDAFCYYCNLHAWRGRPATSRRLLYLAAIGGAVVGALAGTLMAAAYA